MSQLFSLDGRIALVTGASRGLGWAAAQALAEHGAHVVLSARDQSTLQDRVAALTAAGQNAQALAFDVSDREAATAAVEQVVEERGRLDILVNNAGIAHRDEVTDLADDDWDRVIATNLTACFRLARHAGRHMVAQGHGRIVNMASIMSLLARPGIGSYVTTKSGLAGLTRALAVELGPKGVTSNAVAPGYISTDMTAGLEEDPEFDAFLRRRTPLGRWGEPREIGNAVLFLASDAASYVNGHLLVVDGGLTVTL